MIHIGNAGSSKGFPKILVGVCFEFPQASHDPYCKCSDLTGFPAIHGNDSDPKAQGCDQVFGRGSGCGRTCGGDSTLWVGAWGVGGARGFGFELSVGEWDGDGGLGAGPGWVGALVGVALRVKIQTRGVATIGTAGWHAMGRAWSKLLLRPFAILKIC